MSYADDAAANFDSGFSCSQSVLAPYAPGLGLDRETALRIASPFGGGIGHMGSLCGAVSGALMVIGLKHGRMVASDKAAQDRTNALVQEFVRRFTELHGSVVCNVLLGCDITTEAGMKHIAERKLRSTVCLRLVRNSAQILQDILEL